VDLGLLLFFTIHPYPVSLSSNFGTQAFLYSIYPSALEGPFLFALPD
jgi:hypothetical protein